MELLGIDYIFASHRRIYWLYILNALVIAFVYMQFFQATKNEYKTRVIWWHKSAQLDYKYFFVSSLIKALLILPFIISSKEISLTLVLFLQDTFGFMSAIKLSKELVVMLYTFTLFIMGDFTRYLLHRVMHTIPLLWKIHSVHHSAEVLNPLTFYRVHPIENILFGLRYALSVGIVTGIFIYLFGASIGLVEVIGVNIFVFISGILGSNLRHSHIPLRYGDFLEKIFISPYQHQLHHSKEFTHKNFGGTLAIWDLIFKSLHIEKTRTDIEYGTSVSYTTVTQMLLKPFYNGVKI